jgi:hypothetical protein
VILSTAGGRGNRNPPRAEFAGPRFRWPGGPRGGWGLRGAQHTSPWDRMHTDRPTTQAFARCMGSAGPTCRLRLQGCLAVAWSAMRPRTCMHGRPWSFRPWTSPARTILAAPEQATLAVPARASRCGRCVVVLRRSPSSVHRSLLPSVRVAGSPAADPCLSPLTSWASNGRHPSGGRCS